MSLRFITDEDVPRSTARVLRDAGFDAVDVRDVGLRGKSDAEIFAYARHSIKHSIYGLRIKSGPTEFYHLLLSSDYRPETGRETPAAARLVYYKTYITCFESKQRHTFY